jgi:hypothetical protein
LAALLIIGVAARPALAWGPEAHKAVAILAAHYMRPDTLARVHELLGPDGIEDASLWADTIAHSTRTETAPWHYIDIPLADSRIDLARDCPNGQCVLVKTQEFLAVLGNPRSNEQARGEALRFVLHFVADLHQPLHCEDNHDKGGNTQQVIFEGHPDNLHWVWDTGLVQEISPDPQALAAALEHQISSRDAALWERGSLQDWVMESHRLAQTAVYRGLLGDGTPTLGRAYDERAEATIKLQLEKASVRLAYLLNEGLSRPGTSTKH